jgi:LPS O-antigen subunit length determinant protein (WzzB/FepE family)
MEARRTVPLRNELLNVLDQQIEMMTRKTFASFTNEEMSAFQNREQRIRELQQALAMAGTERAIHGGVFAGLYT